MSITKKIVIASIIMLVALGAFIKVALANDIGQNRPNGTTVTIRELTEYEKLTMYLYEQVDGNNNYQLYAKLKKVIHCESEWLPTATGDSGKAYSICQFHRPTFDDFKVRSGMTDLTYENPYDQIKLMVWAYNNKLESHWTCNKLVDSGKYKGGS